MWATFGPNIQCYLWDCLANCVQTMLQWWLSNLGNLSLGIIRGLWMFGCMYVLVSFLNTVWRPCRLWELNKRHNKTWVQGENCRRNQWGFGGFANSHKFPLLLLTLIIKVLSTQSHCHRAVSVVKMRTSWNPYRMISGSWPHSGWDEMKCRMSGVPVRLCLCWGLYQIVISKHDMGPGEKRTTR